VTAGPAIPSNAPKRVLIADPSDKSRHSLALYLREKGVEVIETADGSKALAETLLRKPDLLLLDLSVPVLGPERLIPILRTNPNTKAIPVFFLSDQERSVSGFRPGTDEFIRRPYHEDEIFLRIQRTLFQDPISEALSGDSEISGNLSQIFIPDLWQMLALNRKSGILQVEGFCVSGSIYIERGEIVSAATQNIVGEKALYRLIPLKEGRFRFLPGKVGVRRTIFVPSQHSILEGLRHHDELRKLGDALPAPTDAVEVVKDGRDIASAGGAIREILLLAEFCSRVEDIVNNCNFPDLTVYEALLTLRNRGIVRIGDFDAHPAKGDFLPSEDMARLKARLEDRLTPSMDGAGRIVFFLPEPRLVESLVMALGKYRDFEVDRVFFSLRRKEGIPIGTFGRLRIGESGSILLYAFPYRRSVSPLWYGLAPGPLGIVVFLKDEMTGALENLMAVSDYTRGVSARVVLTVMGKAFKEFGLGENTLRLFRNRVERLGCIMKVREMEQVTAEDIRDALSSVIRHCIDGETA
jgi:CheY-like chemotaxis protein